MLTALVIGATGLVGRALVTQLLEHPAYARVVVLHRRSTGLKHPKLQEHIVDFDRLADFAPLFRGDVLYSAMGATLKTAGSKAAQFKVDFSYQLAAAKLAAENGVPDYVLVSSTGANAASKNFYLRTKGELDQAVQQLGFRRVRLIRPSVLKGGKRPDKRIGERIAIQVLDALAWVPGVREHRPIHVKTVACAMHNSLRTDEALLIVERESVFQLAATTD